MRSEPLNSIKLTTLAAMSSMIFLTSIDKAYSSDKVINLLISKDRIDTLINDVSSDNAAEILVPLAKSPEMRASLVRSPEIQASIAQQSSEIQASIAQQSSEIQASIAQSSEIQASMAESSETTRASLAEKFTAENPMKLAEIPYKNQRDSFVQENLERLKRISENASSENNFSLMRKLMRET